MILFRFEARIISFGAIAGESGRRANAKNVNSGHGWTSDLDISSVFDAGEETVFVVGSGLV